MSAKTSPPSSVLCPAGGTSHRTVSAICANALLTPDEGMETQEMLPKNGKEQADGRSSAGKGRGGSQKLAVGRGHGSGQNGGEQQRVEYFVLSFIKWHTLVSFIF